MKPLSVMALVATAASFGAGCGQLPNVTARSSSEGVTQCSADVVEGIDVSDAQGPVDWAAVRSSGIAFAYLKASQGTYYLSDVFPGNWSNARAAGVVRGAYHFFDPREDGATQAQTFLAAMGTLEPGDLPPALDLECPDGNSVCLGFYGGSGATPAWEIEARVRDFLSTVAEATGREPVVYTFGSYFSGNGIDASTFTHAPLWIADWDGGSCLSVPAPWSAAKIWQYADTGWVPGAGTVDHDRFLGTMEDLQAFAAGVGTGATRFLPDGQWLSGFGAPDWSGVGDFNGDGRADIAWYEHWNSGGITVALSTGAGFQVQRWATGIGKPDWAAVGDFDGDGRDDIAWYETWNDHGISMIHSTGSGFAVTGRWLHGFGAPDWAAAGDFDGDGRADIAWYEKWNHHGITVVRSNGSAFVDPVPWATEIGPPDWAGEGDFDGDGRDDIAWYEHWNAGSTTILRSSGNSLDWYGRWLTGWGTPDRAIVGDFDGDGRADLAWYETWNGHGVTIALSRANRFVGAGQWLSGWGLPDWAASGDFDGDHRDDLVWYEKWNNAGATIALAR